ncbi:MAG: type II secretion system protein, partial [Patescibacteria group bacterium]
MKRNTGFTLIELLVVIAIIGILSSIVLASLNSARAKGTDAAIKSTLAQIRTQASLYYDNNSQSFGTAGTACSAFPTASPSSP